MQSFQLALSFLSIIPSGPSKEVDAKAFGAALKYFPAVGAVLGIILIGVDAIASTRLPAFAVSVIVVVSLIALTRGLHLDGLADTADGIFGGRNKEHMLEIMKDSRIGSFGAIALVSVIALKIGLLVSIEPSLRSNALLSFAVMGRWAACFAVSTQPYARSSGGLGLMFMEESKWSRLVISTITAFVLVTVIFKSFAAVVIVAVGAFVILLTRTLSRKLGGMTGDTLGALIELTETFTLFTIAVL